MVEKRLKTFNKINFAAVPDFDDVAVRLVFRRKKDSQRLARLAEVEETELQIIWKYFVSFIFQLFLCKEMRVASVCSWPYPQTLGESGKAGNSLEILGIHS